MSSVFSIFRIFLLNILHRRHGTIRAQSEKILTVAGEQQRSRPAFASVQSGQRLSYSLSEKSNNYTCFMTTINILASLYGLAGGTEPWLVVNPLDRFSRIEALV